MGLSYEDKKKNKEEIAAEAALAKKGLKVQRDGTIGDGRTIRQNVEELDIEMLERLGRGGR